MSDAEEYRRNATVCADLAQNCKSPDERDQWLRMRQAWLTLADGADKRSPAPRRDRVCQSARGGDRVRDDAKD
jgi:hypothetical protein